MPGDESRLVVVREWIEKAESDLQNAVLALRGGKRTPADTVAFHAQQCAEKYLKALLTSQGIEFPRIHDLSELIALLAPDARIRLSVEEQRRLTLYATVTRYPGDYEPVSVGEARRAVALARRIRSTVRSLLPKEAVGRGRG